MAFPKFQIKDQEHFKVYAKIFDELLLRDLFKLKSKGYFDSYGGIIKEGKEGKVLLVFKDNEPRVIKIYKIEAGNFKNMLIYLEGDVRFSKIRKRRRDIIYAWCKKEFHNLQIAEKCRINSPAPYAYLHNIIIMNLIGRNIPFPQLRNHKLERPKEVFWEIIEMIKKLLHKGKLVHGDLSEFNILIDPKSETPYIIDFAQSVLLSHPHAKEFCKRDIKNLINYFNKKYNIGIKEDEVMSYIEFKEVFK